MAKQGVRWLAIDPGPEQSGYVVYGDGEVCASGVLPNTEMERLVHISAGVPHLVIEMIQTYGMAVGKDTFETCVWIGRFMATWSHWHSSEPLRITRPQVMLHVCGSPRAKPTNIRQALIDKLGPVGTKKEPGPLYGVKSHAWAALALAVTADETIP